MIKNILFDMGGVIFHQTTEKAFRLFQEAGIDTGKYMGRHGQQDFFLDLEMGRIDKAEFCRRMSEVTGHHVSEKEAAECWQGFYGGVNQDVLDTLVKLKKNYFLGLLSNTNPFMMDLANSRSFSKVGLPISHYFDAMFLSYELKEYKPDVAIFHKALDREGLKAEETLFVDDSMSNIEGARKAGLKTLYVPTNEDWRAPLEKILLGD